MFLCRDEPADFKEKQFAGILLARRVPTPTRRSRLCGQETRALMLPDTRRGRRLVVSGSARAGLGLVPPRTAAVSRGARRPPAGIGSGFALGRARGRETASTWGVFRTGNPGGIASDRTKPAPKSAAMLCPSLLSHGSRASFGFRQVLSHSQASLPCCCSESPSLPAGS